MGVNRFQLPRRTSVGVLPKCWRNVRLKCDKSPKPAANAMALIVWSPSLGLKAFYRRRQPILDDKLRER